MTRDTYWEDAYGEELSWVYFSIVDMDGDGVQELVFTCSYRDVIQIWHYEGGQVYGYQFRTPTLKASVVTTDGIFQTDDSSSGYARVVSLDKDGYEIEPVEDYESSNHERIRYYFFSEASIKQWLNIKEDGLIEPEELSNDSCKSHFQR